jgi:hypothetical protein
MVMNLKAIIATLALGSSSAAMAAPSVTISARGTIGNTSYATTVVRNRPAPAPVVSEPCDPVTGAPIVQPISYGDNSFWRGGRWLPPTYRPVTLASGMHFSGGRTFITVGAQQGRFGTLQISGASGRTLIQQVYVQFDNGQEQVIRNLDRTLFANQSLTLDLDGNRRGIARIVVYGNELNNGWRRQSGTFTVTAS